MALATSYKNRVVVDLLKKIPDIEEKEVLTLIYGDGITEEEKIKNVGTLFTLIQVMKTR